MNPAIASMLSMAVADSGTEMLIDSARIGESLSEKLSATLQVSRVVIRAKPSNCAFMVGMEYLLLLRILHRIPTRQVILGCDN